MDAKLSSEIEPGGFDVMPRAVAFDLDDTLAESFQPPSDEMVAKIKALLALVPFAIVSGAKFDRIKSEILDRLTDSPRVDNLYVLADNAAQGFVYSNGDWVRVYTNEFSPDEQSHIETMLRDAVAKNDMHGEDQKYEPELLKDPAEIRYAALGLDASEEDKKNWDPDMSKRRKLQELLSSRLPGCEVSIGGKTTIDITRKGINKASGILWLSQRLGIPIREMLYVGDALYEGGNDAVVIPTGVQTRAVTGPTDTAKIIDQLLAL
jgi:hypothetical protein